MRRHLADDVRRGPEAIEADPRAVAASAKRAVADQPSTQQWRHVNRIWIRGERQAEALVGDRALGEAAIDVVAREARSLAEVLAVRAAVAAFPVGPPQPRDPDAGAEREAFRPLPRLDHLADDLVAEDERELRLVEVAVGDVEVGAADAAGDYAHGDLPPAGLGIGHARRLERATLFAKDHRAHGPDSRALGSNHSTCARSGSGRRAARRAPQYRSTIS